MDVNDALMVRMDLQMICVLYVACNFHNEWRKLFGDTSDCLVIGSSDLYGRQGHADTAHAGGLVQRWREHARPCPRFARCGLDT